jgi:hypothetical protein
MPTGRTSTRLGLVAVLLGAVTTGCAASAEPAEEILPVLSAASGLEAVAASRLCVTDGRVAERGAPHLTVDDSAMRGVVAGDRSATAELAFDYPGPSSLEVPLANGERRRQIGLKLRAQDTCNVVYVMWRAAPSAGIVVQVKSNPGKSTHAECGDQGYVAVQATAGTQPAAIQIGEQHTLRADLDGDVLTVLADGRLAWQGTLPREARDLDGPVGIRSDNGQFGFELRVPGGSRLGPACRDGQPASGS